MTAAEIRRIVLEQSYRAHVGHIGSALCVADIVAVLYGSVLRGAGTDHPDRDRFIVSKGHAALAVYAALHLAGHLESLASFCGNGSSLGVHPDHAQPGIDFTTGSLGHGLGLGAGAALAARLQGSARRAFVLVSDAELNEGSTWEAVMFAAHHRLDNLVAVVDVNGQQALGATRDILDLSPLEARWRAFGWRVHDVDGHDAGALEQALTAPSPARPSVVLARTVFGKGVSYMEGRHEWHYLPMSEAEYHVALRELAD